MNSTPKALLADISRTAGLILFTGLALAVSRVQAQDAIGFVVLVKGTASAIDADGNTRTLNRRSPILAGDTLQTGIGSALQIRMNDNAQFSFNPGTRFRIAQYDFDDDSGTPDTALMRLQLGCFRTISGHIGEERNDSYKIETPAAWIGINGTVHSACFDGAILTTATREGGTMISNQFGSIGLGVGASHDYSETITGNAPVGILDEPGVIRNFDATMNQQATQNSRPPATRMNASGSLPANSAPARDASPLAQQQDYQIIP